MDTLAKMQNTVDRKFAIEKLALKDLGKKDRQWREDELYCISVSDLDQDQRWLKLPAQLRDELVANRDDDIRDPENSRFDPVLALAIQAGYTGATNAYLERRLGEIGEGGIAVVGTIEELVSCPCCGLQTLQHRGDYEICRVCWWEDDGQDNARANEVFGGPNGQQSLTRGRVNFLVHGLYDPQRVDLAQLANPADMYQVGRVFIIDRARSVISEPGADWEAALPT
jgi:hypothetical protein